MVKSRQAIGILGMVFAVAGGIAWFFRQTFVAIMLWGVAGLILFKLNKRRKSF
jgi:4-hydroxybenzoate polyprenyltransferase